MLSLVSDHVGDTKEGISLLELKNHTILNYLISVLTLVLRKVCSSLLGHHVISISLFGHHVISISL